MPSRKVIKPQVLTKISVITGVAKAEIKEKDRLFQDLGMGPTVRKAMGLPYTKIATKYAGGLHVTMKSAGALVRVKNSIDLVTKRSQGKS